MKKNYNYVKSALVFFMICVAGAEAVAQEKVLLGWTTNQITGSTTSLSSTTTDNSVESGILGRGADVNVVASGSFAGYFQTAIKLYDASNTPGSGTDNSKEKAMSMGAYLEFIVQPKSGKKISLTKLQYKLRPGSNSITPGGSQPIYYRWAYSKDDWETYCELGEHDESLTYTSTGAEPNSNGIYLPNIALHEEDKLKDLVSGENVIFRLYVWGARNASNATLGIGKGNANENVLSLYGTSEEEDTTPVDLTKFNANQDKNGISLVWETAMENSNSHFELYRSCDGNNFTRIHKTQGADNSTSIKNYNYQDIDACNGVNYYKLAQVDFNGAKTEYGPIAINNNLVKPQNLSAYYTSGKTVVEIVSSIPQRGDLKMSDINGRILYKKSISVVAGSNRFEIDDLPKISGMCVITFKDGSCKFLK